MALEPGCYHSSCLASASSYFGVVIFAAVAAAAVDDPDRFFDVPHLALCSAALSVCRRHCHRHVAVAEADARARPGVIAAATAPVDLSFELVPGPRLLNRRLPHIQTPRLPSSSGSELIFDFAAIHATFCPT